MDSKLKSEPLFIFIAGPYRAVELEKRVKNVEKTMEIVKAILKKGHYPLQYHNICHYFRNDNDINYDEYLKVTTNWLSRCDALFLIDHSRGADIELNKAKELGLIIFNSIEEVPEVKNTVNKNLFVNNEFAKFSIHELSENMRFFLSDRFRIFSVALLINAAILATFQHHLLSPVRLLLITLAFIVSLFCLIFDMSSRHYYEKYLKRAIEIQKHSNIKIYSTDTRSLFRRSTLYVYLFYVMMMVLWSTFLIHFML